MWFRRRGVCGLCIPLQIRLKNNHIINTGYGISYEEQDKNYYIDLCKKADFRLVECRDLTDTFYLHFVKLSIMTFIHSGFKIKDSPYFGLKCMPKKVCFWF